MASVRCPPAINSAYDALVPAGLPHYKGTYDRLVDVKRAYDPGNLFRHNQNLRP